MTPSMPLHIGETGRHLERQLVVAGREDLDAATELVRKRRRGTRRARRPGAARLDGETRLAEVVARRL